MKLRSSIALSIVAIAALLLGVAWVRGSERAGAGALLPAASYERSRKAPAFESGLAAEDEPQAWERELAARALEEEPAPVYAQPDPPLNVTGRVVEAETGRPLLDAWVERFLPRADERQPLRVACDDRGGFQLAGAREDMLDPLRPGPVSRPRGLKLRAGAPGFSARIFEFAAPAPDEELELELALLRGRPLRGLVLDLESRAPIAGAEVSTSRLFASDETHSDASGGFELQVLLEDAASVASVSAVASGWCRARRSFDLTADANAPATRLYLPRATWVEGRVLDEAGAPVEGAEVRVELEWRDIEIERDWSEELRARGVELDGVSGGVSTDRGDRPVHSAADGSFRTTEQVPWRRDVVVSASLEGGRAASSLLAHLGAPGEPTHVELTLGRHEGAAFVHGRLSLNGEPVTRGSVRWQGATRSGAALVDAEGRFWLVGVEPGKVELRPQPHHTIAPFSFRDQYETLELAPGEVREHDLLLERERGTISGRVTRAEGTPVEGVPIGARNAEAGFSMTKASDAAGRYLLEIPDPSVSYEVVARWANESFTREDVREGSEGVDFVLPPDRRLFLAILDAATGAPISPAFDLDWRRAGEVSYRRAIPVSRGHDAAGRYEYALPAGRLDLVVRAARIGYQPARVDGFDLTSEVTHELALRLEPGLALELRLADGLPEPPREVTILLLEERAASQVRPPIDATGANWEGHPDLSGPAVSDRRLRMWSSDGSARVNGLPPGRLRLCAFPDELVFEPATIELSTDGPRTVELRWQPRASGK